MVRTGRTKQARSAPWAALVAMLATLIGLGLAAGPAAAHSGGRAAVLVKNLVIEPSGDKWQANVTLTDNDSGDPIRGPRVLALAGTKEIPLSPGAVSGQYTGVLPDAKAGPYTLALRVRTVPGSDPVIPFDQKWNVTLVAGETNTLVSDGGGGGSNLALILSVTVAVLAASMLYGLYSVRRRTAVPVQGK